MKNNKKVYELDVDTFRDFMDLVGDDIYKITYKKPKEVKICKKNIEHLPNFIISDMWNDGICIFNHYYEDILDACGKEMDPVKVRKSFNKTMKKAAKWDKVVKSLKGSKYKA